MIIQLIQRIVYIIIAIVFIVFAAIIIYKARSDTKNNRCESKDINRRYGIIMSILCTLWLIYSIARLIITKS